MIATEQNQNTQQFINVTPPKARNLRVETSLYQSRQQSEQHSHLWLQYSQPHLRTPTNRTETYKPNSEYIDFSNNLYKQIEGSQLKPLSENQIKKSQENERGSGKNSKYEIISNLSLNENQKNEILDPTKQNGERGDIKRRRRSSYQSRDLNKKQRQFILDRIKEQPKPKQLFCQSCNIM